MANQKQAKARRRRAEEEYGPALATQLRFLDRSCKAFDRGEVDEAIRIATTLRVLLNPGGGNKKSLIQHLNVHRNIKLLSTCEGAPEGAIMYQGMGSFRFESDGEKTSASFYPPLGDTPKKYEMKLHPWWEQVVYVIPPKTAKEPRLILKRKNIVLEAANSDGGAHFDATRTPEYEGLSAPGAVGYWVEETNGVEYKTPISGAHFICLRQIGYEVLHSRDLLNTLESRHYEDQHSP